MQQSDKQSPEWEIETPGQEAIYVKVLFGNKRIVLEQDSDMVLVDLEEAKELVNVLQSAIDYAEEN